MASSRNRLWLVLALVLLTVVAGCSGAGLGGSGGDAAQSGAGDGGDGGGGASGDTDYTGESAQGPGDVDLAALQERDVIYTGRVVLEVDDFETARSDVGERARAHGGFVSDARSELNGAEDRRFRTGVVVLRVPSENFTVLMEEVRDRGTVLSWDRSEEDVTDQLVDIEARLSSLRTQRERLRGLYDDANDTEEVLAVEERLSDVQTEIERLEARQQSLERQVAYSTITVELQEERPETLESRWYDVGVLTAFLDSIDGVVVTLRAVVVALAYALPYLLVFGVPVGAAAFVWRRR